MSSRAAISIVAGALLGATCALILGQDAGHDLLNYHWYNPWALLHGRMAIDLAPAQLQTYFNPTLDLVYYGAIQLLGPAGGTALIGALQGMCLPLLWAIGERALDPARGATGRALQGLAAVIGCIGTVGLTVVGASRGDGFVAVGVLGGLLLLLRAADRRAGGRAVGYLLAGTVLGATVGLKPTALAYAVGAGAAVLTARPQPARRASWLLAGGLSGYLLTGGWWAVVLLRRFGNPVFPMANQLFQSRWASSLHYGQTYAMARGPLDLLLRPYEIMSPDALGWELPFGDDRLALAMTLSLVAIGRYAATRIRARGTTPLATGAGAQDTPAGALVLRFTGFGYLVWLVGSGYFRFQLALEALVPLVALLLIERIARSQPLRVFLGAVALLIALWPLRSAPGGRAEFGDDLFGLVLPELPALKAGQERIVVLAGADPLAFVASEFPSPARFLCLFGNMTNYQYDPLYEGANGQAMQAALARVLRDVPGPVYALVGPTGIDDEALAAYGLERVVGACSTISLRIGDDIELCDVQRIPPSGALGPLFDPPAR